jgi:hypothetical protein
MDKAACDELRLGVHGVLWLATEELKDQRRCSSGRYVHAHANLQHDFLDHVIEVASLESSSSPKHLLICRAADLIKPSFSDMWHSCCVSFWCDIYPYSNMLGSGSDGSALHLHRSAGFLTKPTRIDDGPRSFQPFRHGVAVLFDKPARTTCSRKGSTFNDVHNVAVATLLQSNQRATVCHPASDKSQKLLNKEYEGFRMTHPNHSYQWFAYAA